MMVKKKADAVTNETGAEASSAAQAPPNPDGYFSTPSRVRAIACLAQMATIYREILNTELERQERLPERINWLEGEIQRLVVQGRNLRADDATQIFEIYEDYKQLRQM